MEKLFVTNRKEQELATVVENTDGIAGLAFVMHGQGGFKEQSHVRTFVQVFLDAGYTVVTFDVANTIGESKGGKMEDATITSYYEDLEDIIKWAKFQEWYVEPFCLAGHSLGGICTALYAENYPEKVRVLAPISTVVSGKLSKETYDPKYLKEWEETGYEIKESRSKPGVMKKLKWENMIDRMKYDLIPEADKLIMPVLMIVGSEDTGTPYAHQKMLFEAIPHENKEIHIIDGAEHTFRDKKHLDEIKEIFDNWVNKI